MQLNIGNSCLKNSSKFFFITEIKTKNSDVPKRQHWQITTHREQFL